MGGRYCAINSPRGSRWGQKSRDRRSRYFCPHRGPSSELIAQYRPPMSFCFYPTLYLGNHLYFLKPDSSWKQQKNTRISEINSVHSNKRVTSQWCPSSRARQTLQIFHVGKLRPNHSCILIQESFWITIHLYLVKQFKIESSDIYQILDYFQNFDIYFINRYLTVWGFTIVFPQVPLLKKLLDFPIHLLIPAYGQFVNIKTSQDELSFGKTLFSPRNNLFHTQRIFFSGKVQIPKWAPLALNGTANQIAWKSWNHRGQYWTFNPMAPKPWISHPSVG